MALKSYRELDVWQKAIELVEAVYSITKQFPEEERFGLTSQSRRAAVSIPANIAEGYGRRTRGDYVRHLSIANGSLFELETHLIIAGKIGYIDRPEAAAPWNLMQDVGKMLRGMMTRLSE